MTPEQARDVLTAAFGSRVPPDARLALRAFARRVGVRTTIDALVRWLSMESTEARTFAHAHLSAAQSARHPATLGRIVRAARRLGFIGWTLATERRSSTPVVAREPDDPRDRAILALLREGITQRSLVGMDVADAAPEGQIPFVRVRVQGQREVREIGPETAEALRAWLRDRGTDSGLLFVSRDRAAPCRTERPMRRTSIQRIVRRYAPAQGV